MADRYCGNCGQELSPENRFCPNCGRPVHETAHVPTPEADVHVPSPPEQTVRPGIGIEPGAKRALSILGVLGVIAIIVVIVGVFAAAFGSSGGGGSAEKKAQPAPGSSGGGGSANQGGGGSAEKKAQPAPGDSGSTETFTKGNYPELLSDPDAHKGAKVDVTGQVFTAPEIVEGNTGFQIFVDPVNGEMNTAVLAEGNDLGLEIDDYVHVVGTVTGSMNGQNAFGGDVSAVEVQATKVEHVSAVAAVDPAQKTVEVGRTLSDQGFSIKLNKIEFGEKTTRVYVSVYNGTGTGASFYDYDAKILQGSRQFDQESTYDYEVKAPQSDLSAGVRTDGVVTFGKVDPSQPIEVRFEWYSDNYNITAHPLVFQVEAS